MGSSQCRRINQSRSKFVYNNILESLRTRSVFGRSNVIDDQYLISLPLQEHAEGHVVFFDFLGWFMLAYTETVGIIVNIVTCCCAIIFIFVSVFLMSGAQGKDGVKPFYMQFFIIIILQLVTVVVAVGLTLLIAVIVDALNITQSWYTETWLIFGLYFCPMFFVLSIAPGFYIQWCKKKVIIMILDQ